MGQFSVLTYKGSEITLSKVKWGIFRRFALWAGKKVRLINRFEIALFVPKYEVAIFDGGRGSVFLKRPFLIFYYPAKKVADVKFNELALVLTKGGLLGEPMQQFIRDGEPRQQACVLVEG